jgi:Mannan-binding protein
MKSIDKQPIAALFIGLGLLSIGIQPSDAYSVQDLQKPIYQKPIAVQQKTNFPSEQKILNAYFNAGYGYCDAQMLGKFWNTNPGSAKSLAGKGLLGLRGFSRNISNKLASARQQYAGRGVCDYSSDFSYDDAVALANYWQVPIATAKTSLTGKLESGNLALAKQVVAEARRSAKKTNFPSDGKIYNAYFNAGYGYCDAQMLGKFWNRNPDGAKYLAGKGLLRLSGFPTNISGKLASARQQYAGRGVCDYSSDFSYDDAVALANYWQVPIATAKTSLTGKLESGNLALAKQVVAEARRSALGAPTQVTTRNVKAGPIWNNEDAKVKCPVAAAAVGGEWNGQWVTTIWGKESVCGVNIKTSR